MEIRVEPTGDRAPSCTYCRGAVEQGPIVCPSCGVVAHDDCARELGGACPTPGCARAAAPRATEGAKVDDDKAIGPEVERMRTRRRLRWSVRLVVLLLLALFAWHRLGDRALVHMRTRLLSVEALAADATWLKRRADELMRQGHHDGDAALFEEALAMLERAESLDPEDPYVPESIGQAHEALGDDEQALDTYTRALELRPDRSRTYGMRGCLRERRGDLVGALADFDAALTVHDPDMRPGDVDVRYAWRAECRAALGDPRGAIEDFTTFLGRYPEGMESIYRDRGLARLSLGDAAGATDDLARALQGPRFTTLELRKDYLGRIAARPGTPEATCLRAALERAPVPAPEAP